MTKKEAIHFLYQIADEIQSFLDKTSSPKGQWTSHKRLEALSMAISALYDLFQAEFLTCAEAEAAVEARKGGKE